MPSVCSSGDLLGCAVSNVPWIVGALSVVVVFLIALRYGLSYLGRLRGPARAVPIAAPSAPKVVPIGSPLQPPLPKEEKRQPEKPTPLQLRVTDAPDLRVTDFADVRTRADFGELLTDVILTADGWKKLESKLATGGGVGGLFVREVRGGGGFEALAVQTLTNEIAFDPGVMSDAVLERALSSLYAQGAFGRAINDAMANELIRGLRNGPPFFRKELWRHNLSNGVTAVTQLGADGEPKASTMRSHARLIAGAYASLKQFDRGAFYVGGRPADDGSG
jgi:hypothetical protein